MQHELGWDAVNYYDGEREGRASLPASLRVPEGPDPPVLEENQRGHCLDYPAVLVILITELHEQKCGVLLTGCC